MLLINVGTPKSSQKSDVASYLNEFLTDPEVIPLPWIFRQILVRGIIVPRRAKFSSEKYRKIWTEKGSPLLVNSRRFASALQGLLGENYVVRCAMRYGDPSIQSQLQDLLANQVQKIIVAPMFPQEAKATTGSVINYVSSLLIPDSVKVEFLESFYNRDEFINSWKPLFEGIEFDHLIMSFHGLPVKQNCALSVCKKNCQEICYKSQCQKTALKMARLLGLQANQWTLSFQSRLGAGEWLRPYTDEVIEQLKQSGIKRLAVVSPAFVADCLETLEELGIESKKHFELDNHQAKYQLISSLNDHPQWVNNFSNLIKERH